MQIQQSHIIRALQIPQPHRVVLRTAYKVILARTQRDRRHRVGVALEVPDVAVIVRGQETDRVVHLCRGVDDALRMVAEAREVDAVFLALELFGVFAFFAVVDLERVVVARDDCEFARVVEVEGGY